MLCMGTTYNLGIIEKPIGRSQLNRKKWLLSKKGKWLLQNGKC